MNKDFFVSYRIYYEDTDAGGVVYYANYLKFFERARTDFLREKSILQSQLIQENSIIFVVSECNIKFKSPAKLDDLITIKTTIRKFSAASIQMEQEMTRSVDGKLLNLLDIEIICANSISLKPKKIPQQIKIHLLS
jgi:acyl-CoA thioester hydrolase